MADAYDLRSNLKSKPGSQGTLFQVKDKSLMSPERYHRGYGPERQAEIREAVQPSHFSAEHKTHEIVDTLARSTAPASHLNGVQWAVTKPGETITPGESRGEESVAGAHFASSTPGHPGLIGLKPHATRGSTVLHELGHHVSTTQGNPWKSDYSYETASGGHEEAFADNYAEQHYRSRTGQQEDRGTYGGGPYAGRIQRSDHFWEGYRSNRDRSLYSAHVDAENEHHYQQYPEDRVHADGSSDVPLINKDFVSKDDRKRGVRPGIDINWEAQP